jgi:hypothetical protein
MRIGMAADHGGFELKVQLISRGLNGQDSLAKVAALESVKKC